ncbi:MAG TPA: LacI family DNA-binding transcriptional regulator [Kiritimatiellia bacterium]|nr:LacI family DNA-binding transcriptional regulator [Kiritimatiellia bacterium]
MQEKRVTIRQIAAQAGYSKSTVALALRGDRRVAADTRAEIETIATSLGYRQNPVVSHLMAELSQRGQQDYQATLAMINIAPDPTVLDRCGAAQTWASHAERRAWELGYRIDRFWAHDPNRSIHQLAEILHARSIRGLLIMNSSGMTHLPKSVHTLCEPFSCLVVGNRMVDPPLNFVCNDQYNTALETVKRIAARGALRPGLVLWRGLDHYVELRFSGGFQKGCELAYPGRTSLPVLTVAANDQDALQAWVEKNAPDAIICINEWPQQWLHQQGIHTDCFTLDCNQTWRPLPGMDQNNPVIGAVAAEQLIGQIHRQETGIPEVTRCVLIESTWKDPPPSSS